MLNIAICDKDECYVKKLMGEVKNKLKQINVEADVVIYAKTNELMKRIKEYDVVYWQIKYNEIECVEKIEHLNPKCILIAMGKIEDMRFGFEINARRFLVKPFGNDELNEIMNFTMQMVMHEEMLELYEDRKHIYIEQKNIQYVEAYDGYVRCITDRKIFRKDITLKDIETILDSRLFQKVNRTYIVNMLYIDSYEKGYVSFKNKKVMVSGKEKKQFDMKYIELISNQEKINDVY